MRARLVVTFVLLTLVVGSAIGVTYSKHKSRRLFVQLQELQRERDQLNIEWGKLQLEQGAWATPGRVERIAREQLDMRVPNQSDMVILSIDDDQ
ncbi:MAG TPA: cell division protein FtsL [Nitrococcus sp.]|nr:cell division protein FtsL [Nitrococcus sp.]